MRLASSAFLAVLSMVTTTVAHAEDRIRVFAAASLTQPLTQILSEIAGTDGVFGSSGTLARQILSGAPADIFISAHPRWTDYLTSEGVLSREDVAPYLRNTLVLVGGSGVEPVEYFDVTIAERLRAGRLAIGDPDHVPAGQYARQALTAAGIWPHLESSAVRAASVRAALAFVERDAVEYGIVYASDAASSSTQRLYEIPETLHDPILYTIALVRDTPAGRSVLDKLKGTDSRADLSEFGFILIAAE